MHGSRLAAATAACLLSILLIAEPALAAPGDLDPTFDTDGTVTTAFPVGAYANDVAIQADDKIVAVGAAAGESGTGEFAVARYGTDGSLDPDFDADGMVTTPIAGGDYDEAKAVAIQANGRIVVAGTDSGRRFAVVRYRTDGRLDPRFGGDGIVRANLTPREDVAYDVGIQSDGRIVVGGTAGGGRRLVLVRYRRNGALDRTFGDGGKVIFVRGPRASTFGGALVLQPDGKIVVTGYSLGLVVARFRSDGTPDPSFGGDGIVRDAVGGFWPQAVALQANGKILVGGDLNIFEFGLARFTARGRLDRRFSRDGVVHTAMPGGSEQAISALVIQGNGRIVAVGYVRPHEAVEGTEPAFALARYLRDGRLDRSWGGNGKVLTHFEGGAGASGAASQADGRIVAAGGAGGGATLWSFALARYLIE